jgi:hypothetical protein
MATFTQKMKTVAARVSWKRALIVYSVAVSTIALALVFGIHNTNQERIRVADEVAAREKSRDDLLASFDKPLINPAGDKILIPELKIALPATLMSRTMLYQYIGSTYAAEGGTTPEGAKFASRSAIVESAKPGGTDKCNLLAEVSVDKSLTDTKGMAKAGTVNLAGGKVLYIYQNKSSCALQWGGLDSTTTAMLLSSAISY